MAWFMLYWNCLGPDCITIPDVRLRRHPYLWNWRAEVPQKPFSFTVPLQTIFKRWHPGVTSRKFLISSKGLCSHLLPTTLKFCVFFSNRTAMWCSSCWFCIQINFCMLNTTAVSERACKAMAWAAERVFLCLVQHLPMSVVCFPFPLTLMGFGTGQNKYSTWRHLFLLSNWQCSKLNALEIQF